MTTQQPPEEATEASTVRTRSTAWAGYAACAWALVFTVPHIYWAVGGTAGLAGHPMTGALLMVNLAAIPLCLIAAGVALGTVQSWGQTVPRWLLLTGAWGAGAVLGVRGIVGLVQRARSFGQIGSQPVLAVFADPWFLFGGILFSVAAWDYQRRSRDRRVRRS